MKPHESAIIASRAASTLTLPNTAEAFRGRAFHGGHGHRPAHPVLRQPVAVLATNSRTSGTATNTSHRGFAESKFPKRNMTRHSVGAQICVASDVAPAA